ncbi:MAG: hypothetical protein K0R21_1618 [Anaerocolumna sp.]|nr:hypothetical protein [Anaerocolumna sp.]
MDKISKAYEVLYPGEKQTVANKTVKLSILLWTISVLCSVILMFHDPSIYSAATGILFIIVLHYELVNSAVGSQEIKILKQLEKYLSAVRHSYYINQMVEEAVEDAMENCGYEMRIHARKIHDIITSDDPEDEMNKYKQTAPNKFLRLFLALSVTVAEYGDEEVDGQSIYLNNIKTLKHDIHIELMKLSETKFRFSGLIFITVIPVFFLKTIKEWSIVNLPELESFYLGFKGIFLSIIIYLLTVVSYIIINQLKEVHSIVPKDYILLDKLLCISWINRGLDNYIEKHYGKMLSMGELLKKAGDNEGIKQFLLKRILYGTLAFITGVLISMGIHLSNNQYILNTLDRKSILLWQELIMTILFALLAYYFPYWMALSRKKIANLNMEDEIIQYQSIIIMLMNMKRISVFTILEFMESFAILFKESIQECINDYNAGDIQALEKLREREPFEPFQRLVDSLIVCDKIGTKRAFDEVNSDRRYYQDKRRQENEMNLATKVALGKLIAFVPIVTTIGLYLIVPFVMESINQLMEYSNEWNMFL